MFEVWVLGQGHGWPDGAGFVPRPRRTATARKVTASSPCGGSNVVIIDHAFVLQPITAIDCCGEIPTLCYGWLLGGTRPFNRRYVARLP